MTPRSTGSGAHLAVALALLAAALSPPARVEAMSVLPPTFEELVAEAGRIVRARVVAVEPFTTLAPDGTPIVKTRVHWLPLRTLKGAPAETLVLEFLGGRIGGEFLAVAGMPTFAVGDEEFLFVEPDTRVLCPLIAAGHGRYRVAVEATTRRAMVTRDNGAPLVDPAEVALPLSVVPPAVRAARAAAALTPEAFEALIEDAVRRAGGDDAR